MTNCKQQKTIFGEIRSGMKKSLQSFRTILHTGGAALRWIILHDYNDNMQKITRADIQRYVKKYIVDKPFVAGMIINDAMNKQYKPSEYFTTAKSF